MGAVRVPSGMITSTRLPSSGSASSARANNSWTRSALNVSVVEPCPITIRYPLEQRTGCPLGEQRTTKRSVIDVSCSLCSYAAEGAEAAVDGHDNAVDKARARPAQPDQRADQLLGLAEAASRCVVDDRLAARGERSVVVEQ